MPAIEAASNPALVPPAHAAQGASAAASPAGPNARRSEAQVAESFFAIYDDLLGRHAAETAQTVDAMTGGQEAPSESPVAAEVGPTPAEAKPVEAPAQRGRVPEKNTETGDQASIGRAAKEPVANAATPRETASPSKVGPAEAAPAPQPKSAEVPKTPAAAAPVTGTGSQGLPALQGAQSVAAGRGSMRVEGAGNVRVDGGRALPGMVGQEKSAAVKGAQAQQATSEKGQMFRLEQQEFAAQVSRGLASALRSGVGTVTLRLHPAALGTVRIRVQVEEGAVSAKVEAATREARELLTESAPLLRAGLEARGLEVTRLEVVGPETSETAQDGAGDRTRREASAAERHEPVAEAPAEIGGATAAEPWVHMERDAAGVLRLDAMA